MIAVATQSLPVSHQETQAFTLSAVIAVSCALLCRGTPERTSEVVPSVAFRVSY